MGGAGAGDGKLDAGGAGRPARHRFTVGRCVQSPAPGTSARLDRFGRHRSSRPRDGGPVAPASAPGALSLDGVGTTSRPRHGGAWMRSLGGGTLAPGSRAGRAAALPVDTVGAIWNLRG